MLGFTWFCPVPRISPCLRRYAPHMRRESRVVVHENAKYEKVLSNYESLDYDTVEDEVTYLEELKLGPSIAVKVAIERFIVIIIVGILSGICGSLLEVSVKQIIKAKILFLKEQFRSYQGLHFLHQAVLFMFWYSSCLVPALLATLVVLYWEPAATGGGTPAIIGYLNGVSVPRIVKLKVLFVKMCSVFLILTAGFAVGKEGPLIHAGVILGGSTPMMHIPFTDISIFRSLRNDRERRDMASAGIASGLTAAFSTPIGGVIMAIEEGLTYCTVHLTYRILFCALVTAITGFIIAASFVRGCIGCVDIDPLRFLAIEEKFIRFDIGEIPLFILIGALGGILGSIWNCLEMQMTHIRLKFIKTRYVKLLDTAILATLTCTLSFLFIKFMKNCRKPSGEGEPEHLLQLHCPKGQYATAGLFFFQSAEEVMEVLLNIEGFFGIIPLLSFTCYYFILSAISMGGCYSAGIFVPNLILGGAWGRFFGEFIVYMFPSTKGWCHPQKFAFLGAGAQLCGTTRICFSLGILMFESSGSLDFGLPIFVTLITTKFVADVLTHPIYHAECLMKGIPLLDKSPPAFVSWIPLKDIMSRDVEVLPKITTVDKVLEILQRNNHNGFPIVEPKLQSTEMGIKSQGLLLGLILRSKLTAILKHQLYKLSPVEDTVWKLLRKESGISTKLSDVQVPEEDGNMLINLALFMNKSPMFVHMGTSLTTGYNIMSTLAVRHLVIVNSSLEVVGILTRKDISVYKTVTTLCTVETRRVSLV
ncbi:hypothetical protein O3M35_001564 [Rhynocoris fuscipes]|uniref:Chloride channel protein n=1 Tax=Rhynocoris fuscipes TaxID=488301 RepID=A0AAW1CS12_9HEMI